MLIDLAHPDDPWFRSTLLDPLLVIGRAMRFTISNLTIFIQFMYIYIFNGLYEPSIHNMYILYPYMNGVYIYIYIYLYEWDRMGYIYIYIVSFPMNGMVIFHSFLYVYQRVFYTGILVGGLEHEWIIFPLILGIS